MCKNCFFCFYIKGTEHHRFFITFPKILVVKSLKWWIYCAPKFLTPLSTVKATVNILIFDGLYSVLPQ